MVPSRATASPLRHRRCAPLRCARRSVISDDCSFSMSRRLSRSRRKPMQTMPGGMPCWATGSAGCATHAALVFQRWDGMGARARPGGGVLSEVSRSSETSTARRLSSTRRFSMDSESSVRTAVSQGIRCTTVDQRTTGCREKSRASADLWRRRWRAGS
jgi:hypothetical protein